MVCLFVTKDMFLFIATGFDCTEVMMVSIFNDFFFFFFFFVCVICKGANYAIRHIGIRDHSCCLIWLHSLVWPVCPNTSGAYIKLLNELDFFLFFILTIIFKKDDYYTCVWDILISYHTYTKTSVYTKSDAALFFLFLHEHIFVGLLRSIFMEIQEKKIEFKKKKQHLI